jgi:probable rRNA maturation factor
VKIHCSNQQSALELSTEQVEQLVRSVISTEGQTCDEVSIQFVDTETICRLHADFFDDPSVTDCISFPIDAEGSAYRMLGEVFVCPATAVEYAKVHQSDPFEETTLYVVHGLLHLMGYDDIEPEDEPEMRQAEKRHMAALAEKNLVLRPLVP